MMRTCLLFAAVICTTCCQAGPPAWLADFADYCQSLQPTKIVVDSVLYVGMPDEGHSRFQFRRSAAAFELIQDHPEDSALRRVETNDGVTSRQIQGWNPGDKIELPIVPAADGPFHEIRGLISPVDPSKETRPELSEAGVRPGGVSFSDAFRQSEPAISESGDLTLVRFPDDPNKIVAMTRFLFVDPSKADPADVGLASPWLLKQIEFPDESTLIYESLQETDAGPFPQRYTVTMAGITSERVISEVSFQEQTEPIEPLKFLEGMAIRDTREPGTNWVIWGRDGPGTTVTADELSIMGYEPRRPLPPDDAIGGREEGFGWVFWAVNGILVAAIGGLLWLRRSAA